MSQGLLIILFYEFRFWDSARNTSTGRTRLFFSSVLEPVAATAEAVRGGCQPLPTTPLAVLVSEADILRHPVSATSVSGVFKLAGICGVTGGQDDAYGPSPLKVTP